MIETLKDFITRVDRLGINYMLTGSFAMSLFAPSRTTYDIDIVVEIKSADAERFARAFQPDYYIESQSIMRAVRNRSMFNIINISNAVKIDCIVRKDSKFDLARFERRERASLDDVNVWTTTKEDLMLAKLNWASESLSEMQFRDVATIAETGYDREYVESSIQGQNLHGVWQEFCKWKIRIKK